MKLQTILAVAAAATVALPMATVALPTAASAAGSVSGGPAKVAGGYSVTLHAEDTKKDRLTVVIDRGTTARGQSDVLTFTSGVRVTVRGASASIRGSLGSHGTVDLRLRNARKDAGRKLRKGCTGTPSSTYSGRLEGTLRLRLPNGKQVTIRSLPASAASGGGRVECRDADTRKGDGGDGDGSGDSGEPRLLLSTQVDGASVTFHATKTALTLTRNVPAKKGRGATVVAMTSVRASGSNLLTPSGGGAAASVKSAGAFAGSGTYNSIVGPGPTTTGPLSGGLTVKLQGAPVINVVGENAVLINGDKG